MQASGLIHTGQSLLHPSHAPFSTSETNGPQTPFFLLMHCLCLATFTL